MKIITCASYHGTGSSALTDLISEYEEVASLGDYEFTFLYAMDGVADLEYHLTDFPDRHSSGHAIKRFKRLVDFNGGKWFNKRYEPYFNNKYKIISYQYIQKLIDFKISGSSFYSEYDRGTVYYYINSLCGKICRLLRIKNPLSKTDFQLFSNLSKEQFLKYTQDYVHDLLENIDNKGQQTLMIDQLLPSSNTLHCMRYLTDEVKVFIVDRDPRDVFLINKYFWKENNVPTDPELFCKWFISTHCCAEGQPTDASRMFHIYFEDLIYNYKTIVNKIQEWCDLDESQHKAKFSKFNPKRSIVNTRLWEKFDEKDAMMIIEKKLKKYLYPYDSLSSLEIEGINIENAHPF